jgi:hypothetical protein
MPAVTPIVFHFGLGEFERWGLIEFWVANDTHAGYCGKSTVLDEALAEWAESYGDQTEQDHAKLVASIKRGETKAEVQSDDGS